MKREAWKSFLIASLMAFCLGFSGVACIVTGLDFPQVNLGEIAVFCALFAIIAGALICLVKWGGWYFTAAGCLALGYLWRRGTLLHTVEALLYHISSRYHLGYGTPVIRWSEGELPAAAMTPALCILAGLVMLAVILVISNRTRAALAVIPALLPLAACLVLTDTLPDIWCLAVMIGALVLLVLTNTVRRRSRIDGNRLTARLLIPSLLLTALLFWAVPEERQELFTEANLQDILGMLQELPFVQMDASGILRIEFGTIDTNHYPLESVGPNRQGNYRVMTVRSEKGGTVYLRGQAYDLYDGKNWDVSDLGRKDQYPMEKPLPADKTRSWRTQDMVNAGTMTVTTLGKHSLYYTPYFLGEEEVLSLVGGKLPNPDGKKQYSFDQYVPKAGYRWWLGASMSAQDFRAYTQLPTASAEKFYKIAPAALDEYFMGDAIPPGGGDLMIDPEDDRYHGGIASSTLYQGWDVWAQAVGEYVRKSARYDLMTGYMPENEEDFALWFLEESETGYCIHFATAAAMLLRALGVPARLVTGYAMDIEPGQDTVVTADKAHAWVEYFSDRNGWKILDPTPGSVGDPNRVPTVEPTEPEITVPPTTEPTQPTETTAPETESTEPTLPDTTAPTDRPNQQNPSRPTEAPTVPGDQPPAGVDMGVILKILGWVGGVFLFLAVLIGQAELRLLLRQRRWKRKNGNERCIGLWREIEYRCTVLRLKPDPQVVEIAEKAKFSQHSISREEWLEMKRFYAGTSQWVQDSPWYRKILFILIFAIR